MAPVHPAGQAGHQVSHGLALDRGEQPSAGHQAIVTAGQRPPDRANLPPAEPVGIPLMGVDRDLQPGDPGRPGGGVVTFGWACVKAPPPAPAAAASDRAPAGKKTLPDRPQGSNDRASRYVTSTRCG